MPSHYETLRIDISQRPRTWLITGVAGFIGSNLLETLLRLEQRVVGLDNFSTGYQRNLDDVQALVSPEQWGRFGFHQGDIRQLDDCRQACAGVDHVLHQAALGSVPRSLEDPITANGANVDGFLNMLVAARDAGVQSFCYASSSAVYGDDPGLSKVEEHLGAPLSPYAVTKVVNELYAEVFARAYGFNAIGLRYFNGFGPRQDPNGAYAAVIPRWIAAMIRGEDVVIYGDGETSRDFCFVDNVVQANLLAATTVAPEAVNPVYNVAVGERTTLNALYAELHRRRWPRYPRLRDARPVYCDFRAGDVRHSLADISRARRLLGYAPTQRLGQGLERAMAWYIGQCGGGRDMTCFCSTG